jgi:hypothetical protein
MTNEYSLFCSFIKGIVIQSEILQKDPSKQFAPALKFETNHLINAAKKFEKRLHLMLQPEMAECENEVNEMLYGLYRQIHSMDSEMKQRFFNYLEGFNDVEKMAITAGGVIAGE